MESFSSLRAKDANTPILNLNWTPITGPFRDSEHFLATPCHADPPVGFALTSVSQMRRIRDKVGSYFYVVSNICSPILDSTKLPFVLCESQSDEASCTISTS